MPRPKQPPAPYRVCGFVLVGQRLAACLCSLRSRRGVIKVHLQLLQLCLHRVALCNGGCALASCNTQCLHRVRSISACSLGVAMQVLELAQSCALVINLCSSYHQSVSIRSAGRRSSLSLYLLLK